MQMTKVVEALKDLGLQRFLRCDTGITCSRGPGEVQVLQTAEAYHYGVGKCGVLWQDAVFTAHHGVKLSHNNINREGSSQWETTRSRRTEKLQQHTNVCTRVHVHVCAHTHTSAQTRAHMHARPHTLLPSLRQGLTLSWQAE